MNAKIFALCVGMLGVAGLLVGGCEFSGVTIQQQQDLLAEANELKEAGQLDDALAAFEKALEVNAALTDAHIGIGDIYEIKGDYETAARNYENAVDLAPRSFQANYKLGLMYHLLNRLTEAVRTYLSALTIDPNSFEANLNIATAYLQLNQPGLAVPYGEKATSLNPRSQPAHANLAAIYATLGRHEEAVNHYRSAAEYGELLPEIAINLANSFIKLKRYSQAANTLQTLLLTSKVPEAYERLGFVQFKMREYDKSLASYEQALAVTPDLPAALNGIGVNLMASYLMGDRQSPELRDRAIAMWQKSVRVKPNQPRIIDLIARFRRL